MNKRFYQIQEYVQLIEIDKNYKHRKTGKIANKLKVDTPICIWCRNLPQLQNLIFAGLINTSSRIFFARACAVPKPMSETKW